MTMSATDVRTLHQTIDRLSPEQLEALRQFLSRLETAKPSPIYRIYEHAVDTEIEDLAENHDHYLYGTPGDGHKHG